MTAHERPHLDRAALDRANFWAGYMHSDGVERYFESRPWPADVLRSSYAICPLTRAVRQDQMPWAANQCRLDGAGEVRA